ncbi:MAG: MFS transporter [Spirochaetaceae bacterium]|nr:MFS transporter [Spirochaetaceae bacterium]
MTKFNKLERSWIMCDFANAAYSIMITTAIFPMFFNSVAREGGLTGDETTTFLNLANSGYAILMALLAPVLGTISDYLGFKKKFFTFFLIIGLIGTGLMATIQGGAWVYALILYVISAIGMAGSVVFGDALLMDVTPKENMHKLSSFSWGFGYIGGLIPFIIAVVLYQAEIMPIRFAFAITAAWWLIFIIPFLKNVKQRYGIAPEPKPVVKSFNRLLQTFKEARKYKKIFIFLLAFFFYIDGVGTIFKVAVDFALRVGIPEDRVLIVLVGSQLVAIPSTIFLGRLSSRYSIRRLITISIIVYMVAVSLATFVTLLADDSALSLPLFVVMAVLVSMFIGLIQSLSRSYFAQIIPRDKAGQFFGLYDIFAKFAAIIGPLFIAFGAWRFGGYTFGMLSLLGMFIVGLILFHKAYKMPLSHEVAEE